uniref:Ferredoxin--nitrite reductase, chloroplastic n=1 Tax=Nannochloropsis sp. W2J3B TaxID=1115694 RepID=G9DR04_9STRA|nr:nitrite reductase [Nannochloropsis sp. W2J3B]
MRIPNGLLTSKQLFFISEAMAKYGDDYEAVVDITTRQNLQLRGLKLEDTSDLITGLVELGLGSYSSGLDNVRNVVGSPLAGIDSLEDFDTRQIWTNHTFKYQHTQPSPSKEINDMVTGNNKGNPEWANLPRKFNIAVSGSRDDYAHTHINDIGLQAVRHEKTGEAGFNVVLGGYFSTKRAAGSVDLNLWVPPGQVLNLCYSILRIFRDHGHRKDRQKARLLWLIEEWGLETFRNAVLEEMQTNAKYGVGEENSLPVDGEQRHAGYSWVGLHVPVGRFRAFEIHELGRLAEKYSGGEMRLTVEQNVIFPNVRDEEVASLLADPFIAGGRFKINPGPIARGLVACTGAQFCGVGLVETKTRAIELAEKLEAAYDIPQTVRMHFSGCPNSCGQSQVADIGLMGAPAKKDGKAVEGVDVFLGGAVGEGGWVLEAALGEKFLKNVAMGEEDSDVLSALGELLVERFGAVKK